MPRPRVYPKRSRGALLTPPVTIPSPLPALPSTNHRFFTPFFSAPSELLFSQLLSFHNHLRCPGVWGVPGSEHSNLQTFKRANSFGCHTYEKQGGREPSYRYPRGQFNRREST